MKKMIVAIMVLVAMLSAAIVPVDRAKTVAENYYQNYAPSSAKSNTVVKTLTKEYLGQPTWYVFGFTKGFVIVAADDNVRPILGYSFTSPIDEDIYNTQNPFVSKFSNYDREIVHEVREIGLERPSQQKIWKDMENKIFPAPSTSKVSKGPLLETTWGQNYPFNTLCPPGTPVGCVATAMHQIMRFHLGPEDGNGANSYTDSSGDTTGSHSVTFTGQTYDWGLMMTTNGATGGQDEVDELSKMAYHLGVSVNMDYNTDGSGSYMTDALTAYQNNWGYADAVRVYMGTVTDSSTQNITIKTNIDLDRPMEFAGSSAASGGHAYVVDGYNIDTGAGIYQYHFNWGWSGSYDGWFYLQDLTPGTYDFTEGQEYIHTLWIDGLLAQMPPPENLLGSVNATGDVSLTWDAPTTVVPMGTLVDYRVYRDNVEIGTVGGTTRAYTDYVLPEGSFDYTVRGVYENPDGNSLPTAEYTASIVPDPNYPVPIGLTATSYINNRQKIDLAWAKPFIGTIYINDTFEGNTAHGTDPIGWWERGSNNTWPNITSWSTLSGTHGIDGFMIIGSGSYPQWVFQGNYACGANGDNEEYLYSFMVTDNAFTLPGGSGVVDYWTFYYAGTSQGVFLLDGSVGIGGSPSGNLTSLRDYTTGDEAWAHDEVDLSPYSGNFRFGFYKLTQGGGSLLAIDNVILGSDTYPAGNQPTSYEIYRNGSLAGTTACTGLTETYEDNGFVDGLNEYYVRAVYPGPEYSIASNKKSTTIDANPVPTILDGVWDDINGESDLSWYAPGHYPIHWFGYEYETDSWNYITGNMGAGEVQAARTYYTAQEFGMGYSVYLDAVAAAFYEDAGVEDWATSDFVMEIGTGTEGAETVLLTSGTLTAIEDGTWVDWDFAGELEITEDWYVEIQLQHASGTPNIITNVHEEGLDDNQWNSVWYWTGDGASYDAGWYAYSYDPPYEFEDFAFLCYGYNDEPTITKEQPAPRVLTEGTSLKNELRTVSFDTVIPQNEKRAMNLDASSSKALASYNIYRNAAYLGNTTNKFYSDTNPIAGNNVYYITAVYNDPVGESGPTNEVTLGPPPAAVFPVTITATQAPATSGTDAFTLGNTGSGPLNYDLAFDYTDQMTQPVLPAGAQNDFASSLSPYTAATTGAAWNLRTNTDNLDGTQYAYVVVANTSSTATLTSQTFDGTGCTTLEFDHKTQVLNASSNFNVYYSLNSGSTWEPALYTLTSSAGAWGAPDQQSITLPSVSTTMQIRFTAVLRRRSGDHSAIDNIVVSGEETLIDPWFSFVSSTIGTVDAAGSNDITCGYDATTLALGTYNGEITVTSNDPTDPVKVIPVILTVGGTPLTAPENVVTAINGANIDITWDTVSGATGYNVYTSADPYGTFSLAGSVGTEAYSAAHATKLFYYITATDAKTAAPKTINIAKPRLSR